MNSFRLLLFIREIPPKVAPIFPINLEFVTLIVVAWILAISGNNILLIFDGLDVITVKLSLL